MFQDCIHSESLTVGRMEMWRDWKVRDVATLCNHHASFPLMPQMYPLWPDPKGVPDLCEQERNINPGSYFVLID